MRGITTNNHAVNQKLIKINLEMLTLINFFLKSLTWSLLTKALSTMYYVIPRGQWSFGVGCLDFACRIVCTGLKAQQLQFTYCETKCWFIKQKTMNTLLFLLWLITFQELAGFMYSQNVWQQWHGSSCWKYFRLCDNFCYYDNCFLELLP